MRECSPRQRLRQRRALVPAPAILRRDVPTVRRGAAAGRAAFRAASRAAGADRAAGSVSGLVSKLAVSLAILAVLPGAVAGAPTAGPTDSTARTTDSGAGVVGRGLPHAFGEAGARRSMLAPPVVSRRRDTVPLPVLPTWRSAETDYYGTGLDIGDVDGNGWLDLAVSNGNDIVAAPNLVYLNEDGLLPEQASWVSDDERYSGHCELADLDGDGRPELMVANFISAGWGPARVQIYRNLGGDLETTPSWETPADYHSFRASFGDPDGDGDLDLAVATGDAYHATNEVNLVYFNEGGVLTAEPGWMSAVADASYDAAFVDFDGDGDQDLAFLGGGWNGRVTIYENDGGTLSTTPTWTTADLDNGNTFDFDDLDGDGRPDLLVGFNLQLGGSGRFAVFLTGGGDLSPVPDWTSDFAGYGSAVVCADVDGVQGPDLICGGWWEPVRIYLNDGAGGFPGEPDWQTDPAATSVGENISLADLDEGRTRAEFATFASGARLLELPHRHLQGIDSVMVGEQTLSHGLWCGSLRDGWISVGTETDAEISVAYRVSDGRDLVLSNWDDATYVFENLLPTAVPDELPVALVAGLSAWPNPFNPRTTIGFRLGRAVAEARLAVFDLRGHLVSTLHEGALAAGQHRFDWHARDLASGVYLYRLVAGDEAIAGKAVLVR